MSSGYFWNKSKPVTENKGWKVVSTNLTSGALVGLFFITVIFSSLISPLSTPFTISLVVVLKSDVPILQLSIFIFLGSFILSVQKSKLSIIFIPVTTVDLLNFKILCVLSTKTGVTTPSLVYSIIASNSLLLTSKPVTNQ